MAFASFQKRESGTKLAPLSGVANGSGCGNRQANPAVCWRVK
jgi:hypothetical protein